VSQKVYFRNIRIKTKNIKRSPADDTPIINLIPNHLSKQEERQGFSLLFDGESLAGGMLPEGGWEIKEGALILKSVDQGESLKPDGLKLTKDKIGPFEFSFEFRTNVGEAVVGIHYTENDILEEEPIYGQLASR